jgi:hypothetical protein
MNEHLIVGSQDKNVYIRPVDSILEQFEGREGGVSKSEASSMEYYGILYALYQ